MTNNPLRDKFNFLNTPSFILLILSVAYMANKSAFAERHDAGIWKNEYETYFFGRSIDNRNTKPRPYILYILDTYDR